MTAKDVLSKVIADLKGLKEILEPIDDDAYEDIVHENLEPVLPSIVGNYAYINNQGGVKRGGGSL